MRTQRAILGLRLGPGHDTGASIVCESDHELKCVSIAEERLSRQKHSRCFPELSIQACLDEFELTLNDIDLIVFEKSVWTYGSKWYEQIPGTDWPHFTDPKERAFFSKAGSTPIYYANHHLLHAASAWYTTPWIKDNKPGAILVIDGRGSTWGDGTRTDDGSLHNFMPDEYPDQSHLIDPHHRPLYRVPHAAETQSLFVGRGRKIERVDVSLRSGIGFFYTWLTECVLGFGHLQEGKSMGLAAYGNMDTQQFPPIPEKVFDGINTDITEYIRANFDQGLRFTHRTNQSPTDQYFADAAAWGQQQLDRAVIHLARHAIKETGARRLGYAGGVALNVVANRRIRDELLDQSQIDDFFIQPAASDSGLALGAALLGYYDILDGSAPFQDNQVYLGPSKSAIGAEETLIQSGGQSSPDIIDRVVDLLLEGIIVGWFQDRSEHGPRALGARSILCWPRPEWMKDHLNASVKHRESFRPFAPIVQEEYASHAFDVDFPVPYMLINTMVHPEFRDQLPAITHADGSGRLQTISARSTPKLHQLLDEVRKRDGLGILLNTSFNDNGEPIVETVQDAIRCYNSTNIDALVCGNALLIKDDAATLASSPQQQAGCPSPIPLR